MPEWIELLAGPILKGGYDFVAPLYARYKYDGTITNTVTYPLTRALYGHRIRQPIGGDFGVSGDLVRHYLELDDWTAGHHRFGIDIWMTTSAITGGFAVCQTRLGAKIHDPKDPGSDLGPMFRQVVGTILRLADRYADHWLPISGSHDVPAYGFERIIEPPPLEVNTLRLLSEFHAGSLTLADTWAGDARPGDRRRRSWSWRPRRAASRTPRGPGSASAATWRRRPPPRSRWPMRSPRSTSRTTSGPASSTTSSSPRAIRGRRSRRIVAALVPIYFGRVGELRHREPQGDHRRRPRSASSARPASSSCSSPTSSTRWTRVRLMAAKPPLPARILIPVANPLTAEELIRLGAAMLDQRAGELSALGIVEVPEGMPLSEGATRARHARRLLQRVLDYAPDGTTIHPIVRIGRHAAEGIIEASAEQEADLIIFGWGGRAGGARDGTGPTVFSPTIDEVVRESPCDIAVVKQRGSHEIRRVARARPRRAARRARAALRGRHRPPPRRDGHRPPPRPAGDHARRPGPGRARPGGLHQAAHQRSRRGGPARGAQRPQRDPARGREGGPAWSWAPRPSPAAPTARRTCSARCPRRSPPAREPTVMVVKTRETIERTTFDQLAARAETLAAADRAAEEARAVPVRVERWFGESNFHHAEFSDLRRLVTLKEKQDLTISLVLPTLNEEETIGPIVRRAMREMVGRVPLLDEILVIDSASTDRTREIAEAEGARVVQHPDILPRYGSFVGKGEALWKSVYEATGDIIVWADTDVRNWHHRMVYGTLGPLLHEPRLQYVKGYYQRPIVEGGVLKEGGGGRVTELVARPLINLFYPELSGMIQPLAGEYAGRRRAARGDPVLHGLRRRDRPPHRRRRAARASRASARSTSSGGSTATRSSRACRGCRSSSSRRS